MSLDKMRSYYDDIRKKIRWFTPLGKADWDLRNYLNPEESNEYYKRYKKSYKKYRYYKRIQITLRILIYASLVASVLTALGVPGTEILIGIASYIGISALIVLYLLFSYLCLRSREEYYVNREILLKES